MTLFILVSCNAFKRERNNETACRYFESKIQLVEKYHNTEEVDGNILEEARIFLEQITLINSEADYGYEGAYPPTKNDLKQWQEWYKNNKHRLYWHPQEHKIKIQE